MSNEEKMEPLIELFLFETLQLTEQLEQLILCSEKEGSFSQDTINEIFRIMHTIKGSSAMMSFHNISTLAHGIEDMFYYLREEKPRNFQTSFLSDLVLDGIDFIKGEVEKITNKREADGNSSFQIEEIKKFLKFLIENNSGKDLKSMNAFQAVIFFEEGCGMENIRAFGVVRSLEEIAEQISYLPTDILDAGESINKIRRDGFIIYLKTRYSYEEVYDFLRNTVFLEKLDLMQLDEVKVEDKINITCEQSIIEDAVSNKVAEETTEEIKNETKKATDKETREASVKAGLQQSMISVSVEKLDTLMDLVGEMVIAEAMVIQNPDLLGLELDNFKKAARQLNKITTEMQDIVMSIRMVPLSATFKKMYRIVRDMSKKLDKEVKLEIRGEETEVDKNIIEHISDPLMHLVRNSVDHGIEPANDRKRLGKPPFGNIILEAENSGSDVLVIVKDDGRGLDREKILKKAREQNLLQKKEEDMTDREVYQLISLPGFSTKDCVTEFSGRGVGMDVVAKNIESIGGSLTVDSIPGQGMKITLRIPLTLAIIDGMNVKVGNSCYTIPTILIKESFRPREESIIKDQDGNEMILVRGECYKIIRLHEVFDVRTKITKFEDGIIIIAEQADKTVGIFVDELLGQQQVVVKALPEYIQKYKSIKGLTGCTLLGDGSISLILDIAGLTGYK